MTDKTCRHCGEAKPADAFPANAKMNDGLSSWCKLCHRAATRRWRAENVDAIEERRLQREAEHRQAIAAAADASGALSAADPYSRRPRGR